MTYKEFKKKYGMIDREMLSLMINICPSKNEKDFSSVVMRVTGSGMSEKRAIFDQSTRENIQKLLNARIVKQRGKEIYLNFSSDEWKWVDRDNATVTDFKSAQKIAKLSNPPWIPAIDIIRVFD
jgi:hypothetical protein